MLEAKRIEYIDLAKGICIFLVVLSHIQTRVGFELPTDSFFRIFRMPLYFMLSGFFFKQYGNYYCFLIRKINKLLVPFLFFNLISNILYPIVFGICYHGWETTFNNTINSDLIYNCLYLKYNYPIWFLWCLFIMNSLFYGIHYIASFAKRKQSVVILLMTISIGLTGYLMGTNNIKIPFFTDTAMTALPFYSFGYFIKTKTEILNFNKYDKFLIFEIFLLCILSWFCATGKVHYSSNNYNINAFQLFIGGISGALSILLIAKLLRKIPYISYCGKFSIIILVTHFEWVIVPIMSILRKLHVQPDNAYVFSSAILSMLAYFIIIPITIKLLPYVTAQKDIIKTK